MTGTTIRVCEETNHRLQEIQESYESRDDVINRVLDDLDGFRLVYYIEQWNHLDIRDLLSMLNGIKDTKFADLIDMSDLPSEPIPDGVNTSYPIWSMDVYGLCLVGEAADTIEHITQIESGGN